MPTPMPETPAGRCRRCGECCLRGGPTLMREDAALLAGEGALPLEALVCLRAGEWARDDARGVLRPLDRELLKLAGTGEPGRPWRCLYYRDGAGCGIYARRPVQCRVLSGGHRPLETLLAHGQSLGRCAALEVLAGAGPACRPPRVPAGRNWPKPMTRPARRAGPCPWRRFWVSGPALRPLRPRSRRRTWKPRAPNWRSWSVTTRPSANSASRAAACPCGCCLFCWAGR